MICSIQNLAKLLKFRLGAKSLRLALSYLNKEEVENFTRSVEKDATIKDSTLSQLKLIVNTVQFKYYPKVKMNVNFPTSEIKLNDKELTEVKDFKEINDSKENDNINITKMVENNDNYKETKDVLFLKSSKQEEIYPNAIKTTEVRENNTSHNCFTNYSDVIHCEVSNNEN